MEPVEPMRLMGLGPPPHFAAPSAGSGARPGQAGGTAGAAAEQRVALRLRTPAGCGELRSIALRHGGTDWAEGGPPIQVEFIRTYACTHA